MHYNLRVKIVLDHDYVEIFHDILDTSLDLEKSLVGLEALMLMEKIVGKGTSPYQAIHQFLDCIWVELENLVLAS